MDLKQHLIRQMAFSHATYGPGERRKGVIDHIKKELVEVEESLGDSAEWVDVVILALDGLTRRLAYARGENERRDPKDVAETVCNMIEGKQTRNESRQWPDWRTADKNKAIEHAKEDKHCTYPRCSCSIEKPDGKNKCWQGLQDRINSQ